MSTDNIPDIDTEQLNLFDPRLYGNQPLAYNYPDSPAAQNKIAADKHKEADIKERLDKMRAAQARARPENRFRSHRPISAEEDPQTVSLFGLSTFLRNVNAERDSHEETRRFGKHHPTPKDTDKQGTLFDDRLYHKKELVSLRNPIPSPSPASPNHLPPAG